MQRTPKAREVAWNRIINLAAQNDLGLSQETYDVLKEAVQPERRYDPLTEDDILKLRQMGASKEFIMMAQYDNGNRNSVRENARAALENDRTHFGHFGDYMWDGNLYKAMERADGTNTRVMQEVFGLAYINASARHDAIEESEDDHDPELRGFEKNDNGRVVYR